MQEVGTYDELGAGPADRNADQDPGTRPGVLCQSVTNKRLTRMCEPFFWFLVLLLASLLHILGKSVLFQERAGERTTSGIDNLVFATYHLGKKGTLRRDHGHIPADVSTPVFRNLHTNIGLMDATLHDMPGDNFHHVDIGPHSTVHTQKIIRDRYTSGDKYDDKD